jgi:hypothetical protein
MVIHRLPAILSLLQVTTGYSCVPLIPRRRASSLCASMAENCDGGVCGRPGAGQGAGGRLQLRGGGSSRVVIDIYSDPA